MRTLNRTMRTAGIAAAALVALAACSYEQGAAVYVGDERVPETTVDGYVDEIASFTAEQGGEDLSIHDYSGDRQNAVIIVLYAELGRALDLPKADTSGAGNDIEALTAEASGYYEALYSQAEPRTLTETEIEALDAAVAADEQLLSTIVQEWVATTGLTEAETEQFYAAAQADPELVSMVMQQWAQPLAGFTDELNSHVEEYDIRVNPRYGAVTIGPIPGVFEVEIPQS